MITTIQQLICVLRLTTGFDWHDRFFRAGFGDAGITNMVLYSKYEMRLRDLYALLNDDLKAVLWISKTDGVHTIHIPISVRE